LQFYENGELVGFEIDFIKAVAEAGNFEYEFVEKDFDDIFISIDNEEVDFGIKGFLIIPYEGYHYDFSVPYLFSTDKILTKEEFNIKNSQDLIGKIVAVISGDRVRTTGADAVENILGYDSPNIHRFDTSTEALDALASGKVNAYVDDNVILDYYASNNAGYTVIEGSKSFFKSLYGVVFLPGNPLKAEIDAAIKTVLDSNFASIYQKWFGTTPDVALLIKAGQQEDPYSVFN
jgi:polar amino acid transport system substrate-binding protein